MKKSIGKSHLQKAQTVDATYHDLSSSYSFNIKTMNEMAKKADEDTQKYMKEMKNTYRGYLYDDITLRLILRLLREKWKK